MASHVQAVTMDDAIPTPVIAHSDDRIGKPAVSMRFCIDNEPIPITSIDGVPGEWVMLSFTLERQSRWLSKCFGLKSLYKLPTNNVVQEMHDEIRNARGKRTTILRKVSNVRAGQSKVVSITVRDTRCLC